MTLWIPAHCWRNLNELKTDFAQDSATVLIGLLCIGGTGQTEQPEAGD